MLQTYFNFTFNQCYEVPSELIRHFGRTYGRTKGSADAASHLKMYIYNNDYGL